MLPACFAVLLHASILLTGFVHAPVRYSVIAADQSVELALVAGKHGARAPKAAVAEAAPVVDPTPAVEQSPAAGEILALIQKQTGPPQQIPSEGMTGQDDLNQAASIGASGALGGAMGNKPPRYPKAARKLGYEGLVTLLVSVDAAGQVQDVTVQTSSGYSMLDEAALKAIRQWHFEPARRFGIAVEGTLLVPVVFDLEEK